MPSLTARWRSAEPTTRVLALVGAWLLSRLVVLVATRAPRLYPFQDDPLEISVFAAWGEAFATGRGEVPLRDAPWEYPAGAAAVVVAPALLRGAPYVVGFVGEMVAFDAALFLLLVAWGLRRGSLAGAALWCAAVPLLGPVALARFDVVPTAYAVGGLVASTAGAPVVAGVLLGAGAAVKLWPALLLPLVLLRRGAQRVLAGAAGVGVVVVAALAARGGLGQLLSPLRYQRDRGLEIESLPALPLLLARLRGAPGVEVGFGFGSYQVGGPGAGALAGAATAGLVLVVGAVALLAVRARRAGALDGQALACLSVLLVSGVLVFDKVLSAQYPVWVAGLVALSLCEPASPLRPAVAPLCGLLALTQLVYPLAVDDLVAVQAWPVALLCVRDLLLLVVVGVAARACWSLAALPAGAGRAGPPLGRPGGAGRRA